MEMQELREAGFVVAVSILVIALAAFTGIAGINFKTALLMLAAVFIGLILHLELHLNWMHQLLGSIMALVVILAISGIGTMVFLLPFALLLIAPQFLIKWRARIFKTDKA